MYDIDLDDYEYQQYRMEFSGPDDYDFLPTWWEDEYYRFQDDHKELEQYDYEKNEGYSPPSPDTQIIGIIKKFATDYALKGNDNTKYYKLVSNYQDLIKNVSYIFNSNEMMTNFLDNLKAIDSRIFIYAAEPLVKKFGFKNWYDRLSSDQINFLRKNLSKFIMLVRKSIGNNGTAIQPVMRDIILDNVELDNPNDIISLPFEESLDFKGYLLRKSTDNDFSKIIKIFPDISNMERHIHRDNIKPYDSAIKYILTTYYKNMGKDVKVTFLKQIFKDKRKDITSDGRNLTSAEITELKTLLDCSGLDAKYLRTHQESFIDIIEDKLFRQALQKYIEYL